MTDLRAQSLDVTYPAHVREVLSLSLGEDDQPHWIAIDSTGTRVVLNSAGGGNGNRLFVIDFYPASGALTMDERFRDAGATRAGVSVTGFSNA